MNNKGMQKKIWIGVEQMEFYAFHGVYEEERKIGGKYSVDVFVFTDADEARLKDDLNGTVNYEKIFAAVKNNMQTPVRLIEHLAQKILIDIRSFVPLEDKIRIKIRKLQPPLGGVVGASIVEIEE